MSTKFMCTQCERKFIDWGAEKLGFKCPDCDDMELKEIGFEPTAKVKKKKPTLKRAKKKKAAAKKKKATATKKTATATKKKPTATKKKAVAKKKSTKETK